MKEHIKYILVAMMAVLVSCEADPSEGLPSFANSLPLYVQLTSGNSISSIEGEDETITIELPQAVFQDVNVGWEVSGDFTASGTVTIIEGNLSADAVVSIPDDNVATGGGTANFTLTSVDNGLSLGRPNAPNSFIARSLVWEDND